MAINNTLIIAEIGQAHDGSLGILHSYIDALANTGVDAIKFQTHIADAESSPQEPFRVNFSYEDIIALSNFLGRQGTREYFGNVIRDGKTLADVYPNLYGKTIKQANKTPTEYLDITRPYYKKQYGNGEERYTIPQDNTRVVRPRLDILPDLNFEPSTPLQDFLNFPDPTQLNDDYGRDRVIAQDNTAVNIPNFNKQRILNPESMAKGDYEKLMQDISEEEKLMTPYDSPNLIADFIRKSNEYSRGWKDMSNASETEIKDLQEVLLSKGYNIGYTKPLVDPKSDAAENILKISQEGL